MKNNILLLLALIFLPLNTPCAAGELEALFQTVEDLNIQRLGYRLCAELNDSQKARAENHREKSDSEKVYKFRDNGLTIVADAVTHRVLVIYEQFYNISQARVQALVGQLFLDYDEPTVPTAHDKVVYWAWGKKEKFTTDQWNMAREKKHQLTILATVKLNSEIKITDKTQADARGNAYYIISAPPLLKFFHDTPE